MWICLGMKQATEHWEAGCPHSITGQHGQNLAILSHLLHSWMAGRRKKGCSLFPPFQKGIASCRGLWTIQQHSGCSQCLANYVIALSAFTEPMGKGHTIRGCKSVWLCWSHQKNTSSQYLMLRVSCQWWIQEGSSAHLHSDSCSIFSLFYAIYHISSSMQLTAMHSTDTTQSTIMQFSCKNI